MKKLIKELVSLVVTIFTLTLGIYLLVGDRYSIFVTISAWIFIVFSVTLLVMLILIGVLSSIDKEEK